jgi:phosphopantothenoylcysteine synthetase/decarboxylase
VTGPGLLALVACGAPLAARAADLARHLVDTGWRVRVVATRDAMAWVDDAAVERVTGAPALVGQRRPGQPSRLTDPAHVVVCPATFNTVNKLAAGIADTYAHSFLSEHLATGTPLTVVPTVSTALWSHPVWAANLDTLTAAGVTLLDVRTGRVGRPAPADSGTGDQIARAFDPHWLSAALSGKR